MIAPEWVLTAAHCLERYVLGANDMRTCPKGFLSLSFPVPFFPSIYGVTLGTREGMWRSQRQNPQGH